jgi:hypothetical protein
MARHRTTVTSLVSRLRPSPERFAAAGALQDPNPLLQYQAARPHEERPPGARRCRARLSFDGALLDQAKVSILATALLAPALAVAALAPLRRRDSAAPARRGRRVPATSPCAA